MSEAELMPAAAAVARGEVIAIPTDTVYGLACRPDSPEAVERIYAIKRRPDDLELTILAPSLESIRHLVVLTAEVERVVADHWPGALSVVLPVAGRRLAIPRRGSTLSVRVPGHPLLLRLLELTGPLATTSANRHGQPAAATAQEAREALGEDVAVVLDGGRGGGRASTIIDCSVSPPRCLREGPVAWADLEPRLRAGEPVAGEDPA